MSKTNNTPASNLDQLAAALPAKQSGIRPNCYLDRNNNVVASVRSDECGWKGITPRAIMDVLKNPEAYVKAAMEALALSKSPAEKQRLTEAKAAKAAQKSGKSPAQAGSDSLADQLAQLQQSV